MMCYSLPCNGRFVTKEHRPTVCNNSVHVLLHLYIGLWFEPKILKMLDIGIVILRARTDPTDIQGYWNADIPDMKTAP